MQSLKSNQVLNHPGAKSDDRQFESKISIPENNRRPPDRSSKCPSRRHGRHADIGKIRALER
jgi:hypothetical protein